MEPSRFEDDTFGRVVKTPGPHGFATFLPAPLPRRLPLSESTVVLLSEAERALGRLAGAGRLLANPHLLVQPYLRREAVASSRIEGTQATISDLFDAAARGDAAPVDDDVREVSNYVRAVVEGLQRLDTLPLSVRLMRELHKTLMAGVRGAERQPGEVRSSPNWIGSPDNRPETAIFVPPPPGEMREALDDWERFLHEPGGLPDLVRCALAHYQFETIHPFLDGNGRLGRLLVVLFMIERDLLPEPLLYISGYFDRHRDAYYDRLQAVRERGEVDEWIALFLRAVRDQANDALGRAERLSDLREHYRELAEGDRSRVNEVADLAFQNPILTVRAVADRLDITHQGATNLVRRLESYGVIAEWDRIPGRARRWVAHDILRTITEDPEVPS